MDLPRPAGADELLAAMAAAQARFDPDAERRLLDALAGAELLVPLVTQGEGEARVAARLAGEAGAQALVAFTHAEALASFDGDGAFEIGVMGAAELVATAVPADTGLVLNPAGPHAGQLDRRAIESLLAAAPPAEAATGADLDPDAGFEIRAAQTPLPATVTTALQAAVTTAPTLREAWYAEVVGAGPDHGILVLVGDGQEPPEAIADLLADELDEGVVLDLLPVDAASWDAGDYAQVKDVATLV